MLACHLIIHTSKLRRWIQIKKVQLLKWYVIILAKIRKTRDNHYYTVSLMDSIILDLLARHSY